MLEGVDVSGGGFPKERRGQDRVLTDQLGLDAHAGERAPPCGDSSGSTPSCSRLGRASCLYPSCLPIIFFSLARPHLPSSRHLCCRKQVPARGDARIDSPIRQTAFPCIHLDCNLNLDLVRFAPPPSNPLSRLSLHPPRSQRLLYHPPFFQELLFQQERHIWPQWQTSPDTKTSRRH
jgi:hypothetical protein